jgi:murein DD-endopeptidase MepM/ murein hydrolase activator NlpD
VGLALALLTAATAQGEQTVGPAVVRCSADLACVRVDVRPQALDARDLVSLKLEARTAKPLSFALYLSSNLAQLNPEVVYLTEPGERMLLEFTHPGEPWGFEFRLHYGHEAHVHDADHVYLLPYPTGEAFEVVQGHDRLTTHRLGNRFALDWQMPVGTPVYAARGGRVVSTYDEATEGDLSGAATANHVWIRHSDGTIGKYLHLDHHGVRVAEGQSIEAGELVGLSGATGFVSGPHLHFSVSTLGGDALYQTFDVPFRTSDGPRRLVTGDRIRRPRES